MSLVLEKAREEDIPRLLDIMYAAFHEDPWDLVMFPQVPPQNARTPSTNRWRNEILNEHHIRALKVVDYGHSEIIAFARWHIYKSERPESEWKSVSRREWDEGTNVDAANAFFDGVREKRQKVMGGSPHCLLNMLATNPKHQRRGAGRMLLKYGTTIADMHDLPCYLEASAIGRPLYRSKDFEDVETLEIDMSKWGGRGMHYHYVMVRPAQWSGEGLLQS